MSKKESHGKNKAAVELAKTRWANPNADRNYLRQVGKLGGRPRSADRCPCGKYTRRYAAARNHECVRQDECA